MKRHDRLLDHVAMGIDLPWMIIPDQTLVEIAGQNRVLIENHKVVKVYECNKIHVCVSFGELCICGSGLELARMSKCQLVITGRIDCVSLQRSAK